MYSRAGGYACNRSSYPIPPVESHGPPAPPLSHQPYVYPSPRYPAFNSAYPQNSTYSPSPSPSYNYSQPLSHYGDPRIMEVGPRVEEAPPVLHHLPQTPRPFDPRSQVPRHPGIEEPPVLLPSCGHVQGK